MIKKIFYLSGLIAFLLFIAPAASAVPTETKASSSAQVSGNQGKGFGVFSQNCAVCHTLGEGDETVPDLKGVTLRRTGSWLKSFIQSPSKMFGAKDPVATELLAKYKEPMSDPELTAGEVEAVIEYLGGVDAVIKSSPGQDKAIKRSAAKAEVERGRALFQGRQRFFRGGPSCFSCHDIRNSTFVGAGRLAKELAASYSRLGEARMRAILTKSPFPLMREAYQENPLTDDEIFVLNIFLEQADKKQGDEPQKRYGDEMLFIGLVGLMILLGFYGVFWSNRRGKPVNKDIYDRQTRHVRIERDSVCPIGTNIKVK